MIKWNTKRSKYYDLKQPARFQQKKFYQNFITMILDE
jgi:hypothetical protein